LDPHYLGYFECFNRQLFFEAHEVLEELWLPQRAGVKGLFYKGLIQLAGAFVHLQKGRLAPAAALFRLARTNLGKYPSKFEALEVEAVRLLITEWLARIEEGRLECMGRPKPRLPEPAAAVVVGPLACLANSCNPDGGAG
jgi:predicted metal-dependent hydrolase